MLANNKVYFTKDSKYSIFQTYIDNSILVLYRCFGEYECFFMDEEIINNFILRKVSFKNKQLIFI